MKILIVYPRMDFFGGAELLVVRLANHLTERSIPHALLTTNITLDVSRHLGATPIISYPYTPYTNQALRPLNLIRLIRILHRGIRKHGREFDVINVHNYPADIAAWRCRRPVVWMCNEPPHVHVRVSDEKKYSLRWLVIQSILAFDRWSARRHIRQVVVADQYNQNRFQRLYGIKPRIIPYGIDCDFFRDVERSSAQNPQHRFTVLQVGMLTPLKNQMESLKAIEVLKARIPTLKLVLAGMGEESYMRTLKGYVESKGLQEHVEFTGHLNREQIRALFYEADALLHPVKPQGGWLTPFEAACAGLPIVVSPELTASDLITRKNLGIVTTRYADALLDIFEHPDSHRQLSRYRSDWIRQNLSWASFCEKMVGVFSETIASEKQDR
jgi:glycosyltransferase involved in cell wall biosynthesis